MNIALRNDPLAEALKLARQAQSAWAARSIRERLRPVRELRHLLVEQADSVCAAVAEDLGKSIPETLAELSSVADACKFLQKRARALLAPRWESRRTRPFAYFGQRDVTFRRPRGVVGIIGTWNYPIFLNGVQLLQALTAGNAVLWKPSEVAPRAARAVAALFEKAGFPKGLLHTLSATREAGPLLLEADIDHLVFTGSVSTGRVIAEKLGRRLISSTLELSGCDAAFVLEDADLDLTARAVWFGTILNRGQTCLAVRRVFVPRSRYRDLIELLRPLAESAPPVKLALASQATQAERLVREAVEQGATLLGQLEVVGDQCRPVLVLDARPDLALLREALFAPIAAVLPYNDLEQALAVDGTCPFGLGASIFTASRRRAEELAGRLRVGAVTINDVIVPTARPETAFGGRKDSGWGVTQGAEGLLEMTVPQVVSFKSGRFRPHFDMPSGGTSATMIRGLLEMGHARSFWTRCKALWKMLRGLRGGVT
jgi:acyl-CoA reductase-like NAD-dependent aldehyde dehydrogenase